MRRGFVHWELRVPLVPIEMMPPSPHLRLLQVSKFPASKSPRKFLRVSRQAHLGRVIVSLSLAALWVVPEYWWRGFTEIEYVILIPGQDDKSETAASHATEKTTASLLEWKRAALGIDTSGSKYL
jgi:hypothetical protein